MLDTNPNAYVVFTFKATGCDALMSEERIKDCMNQFQAALKDIPELNFRTSWGGRRDTQDASQDQVGVREPSSSNPK